MVAHRYIVVLLVLACLTGLLSLLTPLASGLTAGLSLVAVILILKGSIHADLVAPRLAYGFAYTGYYALGSLPIFGSIAYIHNVPYYLLGLASFLVGTLFPVPVHGHRLPSHRSRSVYTYGFILFSVGVVFSLVIFALYGVPLFQLRDETRHTVSSYLSYLALFSWVGASVVLSQSWLDRRKSILSIVPITVAAVILTLLAYRTPVLTLGLAVVIQYHYHVRKLNLRNVLLLCLVTVVFLGAFGFVRVVSRDGIEVFQDKYGYVTNNPLLQLLIPAWLTIREGPTIFHSIQQIVPSYEPFYGGRVLFSSFETILPGKQLSSRQYIGLLLGARLIHDNINTLTPSVLGSLYVDFGVGGIAVGMLLTGFLLQSLYVRSRIDAESPFAVFLYAYWLVVSLNIIHSGFLDPVHVLITVTIIVIERMSHKVSSR